MKVAGVDGPATATGYQGWVPIDSVEMGISRGIMGGGGGRSTAAPSVSEARITRVTDSISGALFDLCVSGKVVTVTIDLCFSDSNKLELIMKYELEGVIFSSMTSSTQQPDASGKTPPTRSESLSLNFQKVTWHVVELDEKNKPVKTRRTSWDLAKAQ
jgi:type VI secretion system secreted protein Hcp